MQPISLIVLELLNTEYIRRHMEHDNREHVKRSPNETNPNIFHFSHINEAHLKFKRFTNLNGLIQKHIIEYNFHSNLNALNNNFDDNLLCTLFSLSFELIKMLCYFIFRDATAFWETANCILLDRWRISSFFISIKKLFKCSRFSWNSCS